MKIIRTTLLKTIHLSDGRLYAATGGMHCLLASTDRLKRSLEEI